MSMRLLISGCSFSRWPDCPGGTNICWPRYLSSEHQVTCLAEAGAGNQYISHSIIDEILHDRNGYDCVLVMWSGITRLDLLTSLDDPHWEKLFDQYGFCRRMHGNLGYLFSGGRMGTWYKNPIAHRMFDSLYRVSSDLSLATVNLMEIIKLQSFLKNLGIPYRFMSYVNYWSHEPQISPNGDFGVLAHSDLSELIASIDFDPWIFTEGKNGIYEMARDMQSFEEDGFHPSTPVHQRWAELVDQRLITAEIRRAV